MSEVRQVDKYQTVAWEKNRYSVPRRHAFATVTVRAYVDRVEISRDGRLLAQHERSYGQGEQVLDPLHYLAALGLKGSLPRSHGRLPQLASAGGVYPVARAF